jgi:hypothetical protein
MLFNKNKPYIINDGIVFFHKYISYKYINYIDLLIKNNINLHKYLKKKNLNILYNYYGIKNIQKIMLRLFNHIDVEIITDKYITIKMMLNYINKKY